MGAAMPNAARPSFFASVHSQSEIKQKKLVKHLMRQKRRTVRALIMSILMGMLLSLGLVAVSSGTASATSAYDDVLWHQSVIWLPVYHTGTWNYTYRDVTTSWGSLIPTGAAKTSLDDARDNGGHFMVTNQNDLFCVTWSTDPTVKTSFFMTSGQPSWGIAAGDEWNYTCLHEESSGIVQYSGLNQSSKNTVLLGNKPSPLPSTPGGVVFSTYVTVESGYAGETLPTQAPPTVYIAMGDSYTSGESNAPYEAGTDQDSDLCHRSTSAYPRQMQAALNLGATAFVACSGAVSDYIINEYNQENVEPPQAAFVSDATRLITITIGGNDAGFGAVLKTCTLPTDESGTTTEKHQIEHDACIQAIDDARTTASSSALQTKLETVFSGLRDLGHQDLQVVVAGYPNLLPTFGDISGTCVWGDGNPQTSGRIVASDETEKVRLLHDDLNATIEAAVAATEDDHVHFVDPSSAFAGHELCRSTPWFHNIVPNIADPVGQRGSYHPNAPGETAYANVIEAEVNSFS